MANPARAAPDDPPDWAGPVRAPPAGSLSAAERNNAAAFAALPPACAQGPGGAYGPDHIIQIAYDAAGQKLSETRGVGTSIQGLYGSWTWGGDGEVVTILDANNNLTTNSWDGFNRLAQVNFPLATLGSGASDPSDFEAYTYDADSNRLTLTKRDGTTIVTYKYDALNRRTYKTFKVALSPFDVAYGYDLAGRPLSALFYQVSGSPGVTWAYDAAGRRISEATNGLTLAFTYDADSNPATMTWPDAYVATYGYDPADRFVSVGANAGTTVSAGYDTLSRVTAITRGSGAVSTSAIAYDAADRMNRLAHVFTPGDETWTLAFTDGGQLASSTSTNAAWDWQTTAAAPVATAPNGLNQNATVGGTAWSYDPNGNLISDGVRTFTYDPENRLLTESGPITMTLAYDPTGRLQQSVINGNTTQFLYDADALVAEYDGSGNVLRRYVHGPEVDNPLVWFEGPHLADPIYLVADRQGSIAGTANNAGAVTANYTYDPYGAPNTWGAVGTVPRFRYTGQIVLPEAQLYYYKARIYDPVAGKFLQTDPVGDESDLNLYAYVRDDPVNHADPTGMAGCTPSTGTRICTAAQETQAKAVADVKAVRAGLKNLVTERAAVASGKQAALSPAATALEASVQKHFGNSSNDAINGRIDPMLAGVERVLSDSGAHYNFQEANIGNNLGRASIFGSTIKVGDTFLNASERDREVTEIHESAHKVGANFMVPELYEQNALRATIFSPFTLQNADNFGLFVYDYTHP